jgi:GntR family transcriptional regulator, transcriptional repressor for pyruvate dehydrogenase complex
MSGRQPTSHNGVNRNTKEAIRFSTAKPVRTYESIIHQIEAAIARGDLRPGQRLPSERDLVAQFGVSRASVREALRVLESSGLLRSRPGDPGGGAEVQAFSIVGLERSFGALVRLSKLGPFQVISFRMVIEGSATFLAALHRSESQLGEMSLAHTAMLALVGGDQEAFGEADVRFHDAIAESCGNQLLRASNNVARGLVLEMIGERLSRAANFAELQKETCMRHGRVLDCIRKKAARRAMDLARLDLAEYYRPFVNPREARQLLALAKS